jgi:hypothetical protein
MRIPIGILLSLLALLFSPALTAAPGGATSCTNCHGGEMFDADQRKTAQNFSVDVHAQVGLSCHDCHGGNPDPKLSDDPAASMSADFKAHPFEAKPARAAIPAFCGRCHGNAAYMKAFNPSLRVDQVSEYWTSRHGQKLREGDERVATCVDCHSVHDIRRKSQPESPVHKTHVAETCSRCHSDRKWMSHVVDASGNPMRTDQYARWRVSVHANAVLVKGDVAAPTCNDCHGNHGAVPPGVESISFVCGRCHAREAELFRKSGKHAAWNDHTEMMAGATCGTCHEGSRAAIVATGFSECVTCHENHGVTRPTIALLGILPETPCAFCHEGVGPLATRVAEIPAKAEHFVEVRDGFLKQAEAMKLTGNDRFDWLVDQALSLPFHHARGAQSTTALRPEFLRLFEKFRIGKTHYAYQDETGKSVRVAVRTCVDCHEEPDSPGLADARAYLDATRGLTSAVARADRILLTAHRGGVEVRKVRAELDDAIDAQIELQTLVHAFDPKPATAKQREGLAHAEAALVAGRASLDELTYRRKGLFVALGVIVLVLVALVLKIRLL